MLDFTIIEAGSDYQPTTGHVTSVNGHTGAVTLQIEDIPNLATSIQTINQNLQHKAEKTTVEALSNRVDGFESVINSKATQTDLNTLSGRVDDAEDAIGALEDELEAKASASDLNALGDRLTTAEGNITSLEENKVDYSQLEITDSRLNNNIYNTDANTEKCKNIIGSDAYISTTAYSAGDMCIYSNTAWKCLVACQDETPEEGTYWTQVSLTSLEKKNTFEETDLFLGTVTVDTWIELAENVKHFRFIRIYEVDNQWTNVTIPVTNDRPRLVINGITNNQNYSCMVLSEVDLETSNGKNYKCYRSAQVNIGSTGVSYFSESQSYTLKITGIK